MTVRHNCGTGGLDVIWLPVVSRAEEMGRRCHSEQCRSSFPMDFRIGNGSSRGKKDIHIEAETKRASDDDQNSSNWKKLGLSKEPSAFLENSD
ncbi:hypothetical protein SLE2022_053090 [Rubroshorea leprosula]